MKVYKFIKEYFVSNDDDSVKIGRNSFSVSFSSNLSQKALSNLYQLGKPYVSLEGEDEEVVKPKPKSKIKKKKVKVDEPKETKPETESESTDTEEGES